MQNKDSKKNHDSTSHARKHKVHATSSQGVNPLTTVMHVVVVLLLAVMVIQLGQINAKLDGSVVAAPSANQPTAAPSPSPTPQEPQAISQAQMAQLAEGGRSIGDANAPVIMIEYSSFTCPFCARNSQETKPLIFDNFVENGDVLYVYKHFPRSAEDVRIIQRAECAGEQGVFFEYIDLIYANQQTGNSNAQLESYAQSLGLDMAAFEQCVASGNYEALAQEQLQEAQSLGIRGTPGFLVNGQLVSGAQPFPVFQQAINAALAN